MSKEIFTSATLCPNEVLAGESVEFTIRLVAGKDFTRGPSRLILDCPATLGASRPTRLFTEDNGFVETRVSAPDVTYTQRTWDMEIVDFPTRTKSSWRGMAQRLFVLDLSSGIAAGDTIEMRWGESGNGYGPGTHVTTVVPRPDYAPVIHVRYFDGRDRGLPDMGRNYKGHARPVPDWETALPFRVRPRPAQRLRLIHRPTSALLLPLDAFWNVADVPDAAALVDGPAAPQRNAGGVFEYADPDVRLRSRGLPLRETAAMHDVFEGLNLYWGDVHTHSSVSNDCIEREKLDMTPARLFAFGRDRAGLDFMAVTDHHQPWDDERNRIGAESWRETMRAVREFDRPGAFLAFPGFEFRDKRGDTVVLLNWEPDYAEVDRPEWTDLRRLWEGLAGKDYLTIPHFHNGGGLAPDEWWQPGRPEVEPVLEVVSCHGSYERETPIEQGRSLGKSFRPDRCLQHFLRPGFRYGVVGNSDGHKGHVGSSGMTAVFAPRLDKAALLDAYRRRRVYATSHPRIRLIFTANGALMGSVLPNTPRKILRIDVVGESALKRIDVFRNGEPFRRFAPAGMAFQIEFDADDPAPANWHVRVTQLDNHIAVSSPIWFD